MVRTHIAGWCVALFLMATPTYAQSGSTTRGPTRIGVLGGMNSATFSGETSDDKPDRRTGIVVGGYLVMPLNSNLSLRPELLYSQKGAKASNSDPDFSFEATLKLDYIDVPILLQYERRTSSGITPHVFVGPTFGIKASCKFTATLEGTEAPSGSTQCDGFDIKPKSFDFGGLVGAGIGFPLGSVRGTIGARLQQGFAEVEADSNLKNRVLSFYGSVEFGNR